MTEPPPPILTPAQVATLREAAALRSRWSEDWAPQAISICRDQVPTLCDSHDALTAALAQAEEERDVAYESREHWCVEAGKTMQERDEARILMEAYHRNWHDLGNALGRAVAERDTLRATVQAQAEQLAALREALEQLWRVAYCACYPDLGREQAARERLVVELEPARAALQAATPRAKE